MSGTISPDSFEGTDSEKIRAAITEAHSVGARVVIDREYAFPSGK